MKLENTEDMIILMIASLVKNDKIKKFIDHSVEDIKENQVIIQTTNNKKFKVTIEAI